MTSEGRKGIVVGVDGSIAADDALAWAVQHTEEFGPVRPVYAWDYPLALWAPTPFGPGALPPAAQMEEAAIEAATRCVETLADVSHRDPVVRRGDAAEVLITEAESAEILVVGTRSRGPIRSNLVGSVGRHCADRTPVPLIIVPHREQPPEPPRAQQVVVGVDGSAHATAALEWAIRHTREDATITAIATWQTPIDGPILLANSRFDIRALRAGALATVNETADKVCAELGVSPDRVQREIAEGDPRWVLLSRQETSDLLVLGQRGRTGLPHFFLGSTTTALIHRPKCPIAVIPS